jgi:hypothetical protein
MCPKVTESETKYTKQPITNHHKEQEWKGVKGKVIPIPALEALRVARG